jgi:hypothetical protein
MGHKRAVLFDGEERVVYHHGEVVDGLPVPTRSLSAP